MSTRTLILIMTIIGLLGSAPLVYGSGRHKNPPPVTNITNNTFILEDCYVGGANIALDQIKQDWHTIATQWGIGLGHSCDETGAGIGIAKKYNDILYNGSVGYDEINKGQVGVGINGRF